MFAGLNVKSDLGKSSRRFNPSLEEVSSLTLRGEAFLSPERDDNIAFSRLWTCESPDFEVFEPPDFKSGEPPDREY
ncbi:hypothetical protein A3L02_08970 [Thermococcus celer Vu 13 = JCM 8558]|uniref:Uncharacterized protein n=1 Tax=Thermococcus celer Vu 13 = JCM 8558 TaxID=1293037 RepID=A0A218P425_THECE|nr:hypothetical protein A3L02_08970 [Thermococcus celer Vu 13 = JCM 8558]